MKKLLHSIGAIVLLSATPPALAQEQQTVITEQAEKTPIQLRADQVVSLVNGEITPEEIFTDGFLAAIPPAQFAAISQQLTSQFGAALAVESVDPADGNRAALSIRMERAIARGAIAIDPSNDNRVSELLFQSFDPVNDTKAKIEADLSALPGEVSWWFGPLNDGEAVMSSGAEEFMPIGSTFKLYVLAALAQQVAMGERDWREVTRLGDARSFPSGLMQDWPKDAPVTLHTLASLMISISDNTATDALITELGRGLVYETLVDSNHSAPALNDPFLTTREMFLLKGGPAARLNTYRSADADVRMQILEGIEDEAVGLGEVQAAFGSGPNAIDIEWFASARDLVNLLRMMRDVGDPEAFAIMAINTSMPPAIREKWGYIGYKGGSEPGVLNLTWLLTDTSGVDHALVLSWRNPEASLQNGTLELIAQRILSLPQ